MLRSLHHNSEEWRCSFLGEEALLLEPLTDKSVLATIHVFARQIEEAGIRGVADVIPAYRSLAITFNGTRLSHSSLIEQIANIAESEKNTELNKKLEETEIYTIPVCYEQSPDWDDVSLHTGLEKGEIIRKHVGGIYTVAMLGFIPGFIFLEGLDPRISCPRRRSPRKELPAGSVGIGGDQTGIYSLESPGGWNIIGRTPLRFFNAQAEPPVKLSAGDKLKFVQISTEEYKQTVDEDG